MFRNVAEGAPGVEPVLPDLAPFDVPIWLAVHRELHTSRRIRLVFDLLAEELS
jgi:DNA-binding transcriptional LysR family regulator